MLRVILSTFDSTQRFLKEPDYYYALKLRITKSSNTGVIRSGWRQKEILVFYLAYRAGFVMPLVAKD